MVEASETSARRLLAVLVVLSSFVGCEDNPLPSAAMAGASSGGKPPVELVCPATVPGNGVACNATLFCTYPVQVCPSQSANTTASCVNGRWLVSVAARPICETPNLPMSLPCPTLPPSPGEPCPSPGMCSYATAECPSASAYCQVGQWLVVGCDGTGGGGGTGGAGASGASGAAALAGVAGQPDGGQAAVGGATGSPD